MEFCFFSSRRRHTRLQGDWSSDMCSSDLHTGVAHPGEHIGDGINNAHSCPLLPAGFAHAGNLPAQRQLTEADAAQLELAERAAAAAATLAAVVTPHLELRAFLDPLQPRLLRHDVS